MNWDAHLQSLSFPPAFFGAAACPAAACRLPGLLLRQGVSNGLAIEHTYKHTNRFPHFHKSWNTPPALPSHLWILVPNRAPAAQLALTDASVPAILQAILHRLIWHHFGVSQQRTGGSFITKPESHAWGERCKSRTCFKSVSWGISVPQRDENGTVGLFFFTDAGRVLRSKYMNTSSFFMFL